MALCKAGERSRYLFLPVNCICHDCVTPGDDASNMLPMSIQMGKTGLFIHCNQVEHALRRAPFEQRKKRKREQPDQLTAVSNEVVAPKIPHPAKAKGDKAGSAGTVVRQQKPAAAGKQRLVRTVAVGTDSAAARDEAISITKELPEVGILPGPFHPSCSRVAHAAELQLAFPIH